MQVVFYSAGSGNTRRFVGRLDLTTPALQLGIDDVTMTDPFVLMTPTYNGKVPAPVMRLLDDPDNRRHLCGVIAAGSTNFGADFAKAGKSISSRCNVPLLHTFELTGLTEDIAAVNSILQHMSNIGNAETPAEALTLSVA